MIEQLSKEERSLFNQCDQLCDIRNLRLANTGDPHRFSLELRRGTGVVQNRWKIRVTRKLNIGGDAGQVIFDQSMARVWAFLLGYRCALDHSNA